MKRDPTDDTSFELSIDNFDIGIKMRCQSCENLISETDTIFQYFSAKAFNLKFSIDKNGDAVFDKEEIPLGPCDYTRFKGKASEEIV
jgi:hypothetical protein